MHTHLSAGARAWVARATLAVALIPASSAVARSQTNALTINSKDYFEARGLNVLVFTNEYNGMFFDEKTAGIEMIHHGVRTATGGAVRLKPTPEQWDQIPKLVDRKIDRATNTIQVVLRYEDFDFTSRVVVTPDGPGFRVAVFLDTPVPERLEGRAGLNMEFLPSRYFERTYLVDGEPGIFARYPAGPTVVKPASTQVRQFEGYSTFDDHGRGEYVEADPVAVGRTIVLAPEDPERHVTITAAAGKLMLLDGRNVAQNGWFVVRSLLATRTTGKVAEWSVQPHVIPGWTRAPVVGFSQAGYSPAQPKRAVIELDPNDTPLTTASVFEVPPDGTPVERLKLEIELWGKYLRYNYVTADFSAIRQPGLYFLQYGNQKTETFPIAARVYDSVWHLTSDVWFPVQMDHMTVNEAYRVWHGLPHMDDALQAPVAFQHFDGYHMGPTTETKFMPLERIPGLAVGGWFDAGDFDIQTASHSATIMHLVETWEAFKPTRDQTLIDQAARFVDIHRPDGKPDILQQIEHGVLAVEAQHKAFGRGIRGIVDSALHRYHHLGDASTQTDGLIYDSTMKPYESDGRRSGTADDRWAFTAQTPATNYLSIGALAAASRVLRGFNDVLADECLASARRSYSEERQRATVAPPSGPEAMFSAGAELAAVAQLVMTTREQQYVDRFNELLWPALDRMAGRNMLTAALALPHLDRTYAEKLRPYVMRYKVQMDDLRKQNPYGVPIGTGGWAGNSGVISWASANYYLHKAYPDLIGPEYVFRGLDYIFGTHPVSNVSFVTAVGTRPKKMAYGSNRADMTFIAGGVVPGVLVLKPDFPEHMDDWPFLWGENEVVIDICASYMFLANAANELAQK
jgi:endoglucanase